MMPTKRELRREIEQLRERVDEQTDTEWEDT